MTFIMAAFNNLSDFKDWQSWMLDDIDPATKDLLLTEISHAASRARDIVSSSSSSSDSDSDNGRQTPLSPQAIQDAFLEEINSPTFTDHFSSDISTWATDRARHQRLSDPNLQISPTQIAQDQAEQDKQSPKGLDPMTWWIMKKQQGFEISENEFQEIKKAVKEKGEQLDIEFEYIKDPDPTTWQSKPLADLALHQTTDKTVSTVNPAQQELDINFEIPVVDETETLDKQQKQQKLQKQHPDVEMSPLKKVPSHLRKRKLEINTSDSEPKAPTSKRLPKID